MKTFVELRRNLRKEPPAEKVRIALLGDTATQLLAQALIGEGYDRGCAVEMFEAEYNQVERQVLDQGSDFHAFGAEYAVVFQSTRRLMDRHAGMTASEAAALADERLEFVRALCDSFGGKIIYLNYPEADDGVFGNYANKVPGSFIRQIRRLNLGLMELASVRPDLFIYDLAALQNVCGRGFLFDPSIYVSTDMVLSVDALPRVASGIWDMISAMRGKLVKCLVLDLDNTLWGGVVGDDGWENLQVGHLGIGKAFTEFQQWLLKLKRRGIILTVCSKNDEDKAREPFEKNPEMVLRLDDIAVFIANWDNKADNVRRIRSILNIGYDSMVFIDDNPFERNIVRENLPEVIVPEMPEDPAEYVDFLSSLNLFETASHSGEDSDRTRMYRIEAQRVSERFRFTDETAYLKSLDMVAEVTPFNDFNIPRVAQLTQRSNQFNLRTRRYSESEVRAMAADPEFGCLAFSLKDRFGDNGLICVVILKKISSETLFVDTWLMSCRVLKRGMENFTLNAIAEYAKANGCRYVIGEYVPTPKNSMVASLYPDMGFTLVGENDGKCEYRLDLEDFKAADTCIRRSLPAE